MLGAADMVVYGAVEVAIAGSRADERFTLLEREVAAHYVPSLVLTGGESSDSTVALLSNRESRNKPTAYVCHSYVCDEPVTEPAELGAQLDAASRATESRGT
jgi:uncharacterized protein YyaL (SSP411 family)